MSDFNPDYNNPSFTKWLESVKLEVRRETLLEIEKSIEDPATSPVWCWDLCGDPKCPDDIAIHTALDIKKMVSTIRLSKGT